MGESSEEPISGGTPAVEFAGFWRRLGALLIDSIILGVAGWIIATVFYEKLIEYGPNGRIIGLPIALLYFAFLNSGLAGGGTPGKRVLGIRVATRDGGTIAIWRSLGRAFVLEVPFAANGMDFSFLNISSGSMTWVFAIDAFMVFGILLSTVYLYLANWKTRQVVHDLAARTFVVRSTSIGRPIVQTINPVHIAIVAVIFVITLAAVPVGERLNWAGRMGSALGVDFNKLLEIQKKVRATPNALSVPAVSEGSSTFMLNGGPAQVTTSVVVTVIYRGRPSDPEGFADSIADEVLRLAPDNLGRQRLTIIVRYGFDIGIASGWRTFNYSHTVVEWRARLHGPLPEQPSI